MHHSICLSSRAFVVALFASATPAHALTINDIFDSSITSDPNHVQIEQTIQSASNSIASLYSNPTTISIDFSEMTSGLGQSNQWAFSTHYASYKAALTADAAANPQNTTLATAVANLNKGNDANGATDVLLTSAQFNMLTPYGLPGPVVCPGSGPTCPGGDVSLNSSIIHWGSGPIPAGSYSGTGVVQHEIDEILGGGGAGSVLGTGFQSIFVGSLDLYRYSAPGTPSFTTNPTAAAYFSIDSGATNLVNFNQNGIGDYGDFTNSCFIQNWAACAAHTPENFAGSIEDTMLQSIGYDHFLAAAPGPVPGEGLAGLSALTLAGFYARTRRA